MIDVYYHSAGTLLPRSSLRAFRAGRARELKEKLRVGYTERLGCGPPAEAEPGGASRFFSTCWQHDYAMELT